VRRLGNILRVRSQHGATCARQWAVPPAHRTQPARTRTPTRTPTHPPLRRSHRHQQQSRQTNLPERKSANPRPRRTG
jgi:hypothetical protein